MSLIPNFSQFFRHLALAMLLKNDFNLEIKHKQIILTYVLNNFVKTSLENGKHTSQF